MTLDFSGVTEAYPTCCDCAIDEKFKKYEYCSSVCKKATLPCLASPSLSVLLRPGKYCYEQAFEVILVDPPDYYILPSSSSSAAPQPYQSEEVTLAYF